MRKMKFSKNITMLFPLLLLMILLAIPAAAYADTASLWKDDVYHLTDASDVLEDDAELALKKMVHELIPEKQFDFNCLVLPEENLAGYSLDYVADYLYGENESGYGVNRDGIILLINTTDETIVLRTYGRGREAFTKRVLEDLTVSLREAYAESGFAGLVQAYYDEAPHLLDAADVPYSEEMTDYGAGFQPDVTPLGELTMPLWYVADGSTFVDFHDAEAPKVVDDADLLTDAQEAALAEMLQDIAERTGRDAVVFTDVSTYGLERNVYAADFYTYNGYGIGDNFDGAVFFLCMDPENRGFYTAACGSVRELWTESNANAIDDIIYQYMKAGDYAGGMSKWAELLDNLYSYGHPVLADWYKLYKSGERMSERASLMQDVVGVFTEEEATAYEARLETLTETYGMDFVICIDREALDEGASDNETRLREYADHWRETCAFAEDCVMLMCLPWEDSQYEIRVFTYGAASDRVSEKRGNKLEDKVLFALSTDGYGENVGEYLDALEMLMKTGHMPVGPFKGALWLALSALVGSLLSGFVTKRAVARMETPEVAVGARAHLVPGSLKITNEGDVLVKTRISRVYSPVKKDDDNRSSGSSGGSSYSSGYSSSSGRTYSGSGRDF